jgi:hypothetical protein
LFIHQHVHTTTTRAVRYLDRFERLSIDNKTPEYSS